MILDFNLDFQDFYISFELIILKKKKNHNAPKSCFFSFTLNTLKVFVAKITEVQKCVYGYLHQ